MQTLNETFFFDKNMDFGENIDRDFIRFGFEGIKCILT